MIKYIEAFVRESNMIEGIKRTTGEHYFATQAFLNSDLRVRAVVQLVSRLQPDARLRNRSQIPGVRVGNHIAPPSGPDIEARLTVLLRSGGDPWLQHCIYESLHPFTDGNGRSGRAVWLWRHINEPGHDPHAVGRGFLHSWYYHTLARGPGR